MNKHKTTVLLKVISPVILIYFLYFLIGFIFSNLFNVAISFNEPVLFFFLYVFSVGITIYITKLLLKNELSKSNLKKEPFTYNLILSVILLGISFYLVIIPITEVIPLKESKLDEIIIYMQQNNIFMILFAVIIGPILEEYLFRGILLKSLLTQYSPIVSILITSFLFSLMHLNIGIPIDSFFFAIVVGWLYLKMKSVIPCIILHSIYNGLAQLHKLFVLSDENKLLSSSEIVGNELLYYSIILISIFALTSTIVWLNKRLSTNKKYT